MSNFKTKPIRDKKHLAFIRTLPCIFTGRKSEAAHIRYQTDGAMSKKPSDCWVVPLSHDEHMRQHQIGELRYWKDIEAAKQLALDLYENSGNYEVCVGLIRKFKLM